jgi:hypothetical protein
MTTMTITLPDDIAMQIEAEHISQQQLDAFVVTAVKAWLHRRQVSTTISPVGQERPWSVAFQERADDLIDQRIDENKALFEELARL